MVIEGATGDVLTNETTNITEGNIFVNYRQLLQTAAYSCALKDANFVG